VLYTDIDPDRPATLSPRVISEVIRAGIGFDGVLLCDDLSMAALGGKIETRAWDALQAGCDVVLHCNGILDEMEAIAGAIGPLSDAARRRVTAAEARRHAPGAFDRAAAERELAALVAGQS
jgi:beta-N-acetylhexosaminidase